ncbi:RNA polymerase sigma factor [Cochleicola gelatinilyticus]|uniref:RNA polymerase subunit sigma-70 n=1 Tax=Cochleicola gelatinilyticus TaxID=1763537 RepID=A0A167KG40_9FLAO|nr:sigma-70 family RNA polymerase sigma factor [Cochleicola gelatinilyticus]OAB81856.1 RNA polymerase subunit sigma-70 [Cochleicola gelatinilyticus]
MKKTSQESICQEENYRKVYEQHGQSLLDFLTYKYGSEYHPKDTLQDIFITLWKNCSKVPIEKVRSYLFTLANNHTLNKIKHRKVVLAYQKIQQKEYSNESPEFLLEQEEFLKRYQTALGRLNEEQRVAFLLNKAEGKKHKEIAALLGVTRKVVEYRIYSAYKQLKEELENFNLK